MVKTRKNIKFFHNNSLLKGQAGLSIIELMVSVALISLLLGSVAMAFISQGRMHRTQSDLREAQESARTALSAIERHLRLAGYGIGSEMAIDFQHFRCAFGTQAGNLCSGEDLADGPDVLVFNARNPNYFVEPGNPASGGGNSWAVDTTTTINRLALVSNGNDPLRVGQTFLALCPGGYTYTYVTATAVNGPADITVDHVGPDNPNPFRQGADLIQPCFQGGVARAFTVDRFRFFVGDADGERILGEPPAEPGRPYLYLDRGFPGEAPQLVATDIEDLQVAYIMRNGNVFGDVTTGAPPVLAPPDANCANNITIPLYRSIGVTPCQLGSDIRTSDYVANIVAVRLTVVARSRSPARNSNNDIIPAPEYAPSLFQFENRTGRPADSDGYKRIRLSATIWLPNMASTGIPLI